LVDSVILFVSVIPSGGDKCIANGTSWLTALGALNGTQLEYKVLDNDGDGDIDGNDKIVSSVKFDGMLSDPLAIGDNLYTGSTNNDISRTKTDIKSSGQVGGSGRMSWQQIQ